VWRGSLVELPDVRLLRTALLVEPGGEDGVPLDAHVEPFAAERGGPAASEGRRAMSETWSGSPDEKEGWSVRSSCALRSKREEANRQGARDAKRGRIGGMSLAMPVGFP
jgi:hypothetical protein